MDPITIAAIATVFLTAAASSAGHSTGSHVMDMVFERFEASGKQATLQPFVKTQGKLPEADKEQARTDLTVEIEKDPAFGAQVVEAVNAKLTQRPDLAESITHVVGRWWDWSPQQEKAQSGKCPIGGEILFLPRFLRPDGTEIKGAAFNLLGFSKMPRSAVAECRRGHQWSVFAIKGY
jgi:hypothetical protein